MGESGSRPTCPRVVSGMTRGFTKSRNRTCTLGSKEGKRNVQARIPTGHFRNFSAQIPQRCAALKRSRSFQEPRRNERIAMETGLYWWKLWGISIVYPGGDSHPQTRSKQRTGVSHGVKTLSLLSESPPRVAGLQPRGAPPAPGVVNALHRRRVFVSAALVLPAGGRNTNVKRTK